MGEWEEWKGWWGCRNCDVEVATAICSRSGVNAGLCAAVLAKVVENVAVKDCSETYGRELREAVCPMLENNANQQEKVRPASACHTLVAVLQAEGSES